jgi:hypothetical protein
MTTQPQTSQPKLSQCRKCSEKGIPNVMIYFVQNGFNKSTGKPFWDLKNVDGSEHKHLSALYPNITTQTQPTVIQTKQSQATVATNETTTKEDVIHQSHLENVNAWQQQTQALKDQTIAIKEQTKSINDLVDAIWELV